MLIYTHESLLYFSPFMAFEREAVSGKAKMDHLILQTVGYLQLCTLTQLSPCLEILLHTEEIWDKNLRVSVTSKIRKKKKDCLSFKRKNFSEVAHG